MIKCWLIALGLIPFPLLAVVAVAIIAVDFFFSGSGCWYQPHHILSIELFAIFVSLDFGDFLGGF